MSPFQFLKDKSKDLAAAGFNAIPDDRANMFLRYYTGFGGHNLDLDDSTLHAAREATKPLVPDFSEGLPPFPGSPLVGDLPKKVLFTVEENSMPRSGPVNPYGYGDQVLSQTLGRYNAEVSPDQSTVRFTDQYDMSNEFEDPDLTSGKFQPRKAWTELSTIWDPRAKWERDVASRIAGGASFGEATGFKPIPEAKGFSIQNVMEGFSNTGGSTTDSPKAAVARSLMYLTPKEFTPYPVDITVPSSGAINNQEVYN